MEKNKKTKKIIRKLRKGQVVLLLVLIAGIIGVIGAGIFYQQHLETQITKLEEQSKKALISAESGAYKALKSNQLTGNFSIGEFQVTTSPYTPSDFNEFKTPDLFSGESYTFYLGEYDYANKRFSTGYSGSGIEVHFGDKNSSFCELVVLMLIKDNASSSDEYKYFYPDSGDIPLCNYYYSSTQLTGAVKKDVANSSESSFKYKMTLSQPDLQGYNLLVVMFLSGNSQPDYKKPVKLKAVSGNLPVQGRFIKSIAKQKEGGDVVKSVIVFESYPQLDIFLTRF